MPGATDPSPDDLPTASRLPGEPDGATPASSVSQGGMGERCGEFIGSYKLLEIIGEGGFGVVYLAERREPMVQRVALKVIKPGMDSRAVVARFEQERQALAVMDHPNVAKVLDGGLTANARPYFVMEHVKGEPITVYCDRQRLTIKQRLELFASACDAVQHAHIKGIIHRDLKPSNILVTPGGDGRIPIVKVIDFGVAKAISHTLTEKTIFTEQGQIIGTPEYMSPEQTEMGATDIDTRSDIYSLGVLLYELLSGRLPFDAKMLRAAGYAEIQRVIREEEPPRPSTKLSTADDATGAAIAKSRQADPEKLAAELRRELEWIPLKALRKDRTRRYASAEALGEDVRRYLEGEPLEAAPESRGYLLKKFISRNRGQVAAAGAVLLALVLGLTGTLWQAREARNEATAARQAEAEQKRLAGVAEAKAAEAEAERLKAVQAAETIEYNAYVANVQMAAAAMDDRQFDRVRKRLDACPERLRGWEWRWLNATSDNSLVELKGHDGLVFDATFSPDGTRIVTASMDGTARVWDVATGDSLAVLEGQSDWVRDPVFSSDGTRIVTASKDGTARVWDVATGNSLAVLEGQSGAVRHAVSSPDGTRIVTAAEDGIARVWDVATVTSLAELKGHTDQIDYASFSPDGTRIVTASMDGTAREWDAATGASLAVLEGQSGAIRDAVFSTDGTRIVTTSRDGTARVWDFATGVSLVEFKGHTDLVWDAAFSPDAARVVTASEDGTARVWDVASGASLAELKGHTDRVICASFSPDGTRIVTASEDGTARVWNALTSAPLAELREYTRKVSYFAVRTDGTQIATMPWNDTARVLDLATGVYLVELKGHTDLVTSAAFSPDATRIVTTSRDGTARVWDLATGISLVELKGHTDQLINAAFSPDATRIVTSSRDGTARVWDPATGAFLAELKGHPRQIRFASFSPDGTRIITATSGKSARVWDSVPYRERFKEEPPRDTLTPMP